MAYKISSDKTLDLFEHLALVTNFQLIDSVNKDPKENATTFLSNLEKATP